MNIATVIKTQDINWNELGISPLLKFYSFFPSSLHSYQRTENFPIPNLNAKYKFIVDIYPALLQMVLQLSLSLLLVGNIVHALPNINTDKFAKNSVLHN